MSSYQDFKSFYQSNILLFIILLFVIIYAILNWSSISSGEYFSGKYTKSILITGIIFIIFHMFITWDDNTSSIDEKIINIPKYKFQNNYINDQIKNDIIDASIPKPTYEQQKIGPMQSLNTKYKIVKNNNINQNNDIDQNHQQNFINFSKKNTNNNSKSINRNIFVPHINSSKYGLKF